MKKKLKWIVQGIVWIAVLGGFFGFLNVLNRSTVSTQEVPAVEWEPTEKTKAKEGWEKVADNETMELYFDPAITQLKVVDKNTDSIWYSNPPNAKDDKIAFGQNKSAVRSLLDISYVDEQGSFYTVNSYMGSVQDDTYCYEYKDNGVYVKYQFDKQDFEVACFFGIEQNRFVARILNDEIKQHGIHKIASISLLPYFGAGSLEDEGYMVVPDGAGALIYFNNMKQTYQSYNQKVYGKNLSVNQIKNLLCEQSATMPIFGIKKNDDAFLAIITEGEYQAEIHADVSRKITSNNTAYSTVCYIQTEENTLMGNSSNEETATMLSSQQIDFPYYEVSYFLLKKDADYSDMALSYQSYLLNEKGMVEAAVPQKKLGLSFVGGIMVRETFLGIPYEVVNGLTTYHGLNKIAEELTANQVDDFMISIVNTAKGGSENKIPTKITFDGAVGGKKEFLKLEDYFTEREIPFYLIYDPVNIWKTGNGFSTFKAARNVTQSLAIQYQYKLTTGEKDSSKPYSYLVSPSFLPNIVEKMMNSATKQQMTSIGINALGTSVYGDYRKESTSRNEAGNYVEDALKVTTGKMDSILLNGAYGYAFPYADVITNTPIYSSHYDVEDEEIPFYQIVMSGYASLYSEPVNMVGNVEDMILRAVEYGVSPSFLLTEADETELKNTKFLQYYATSFDNWKEMIKSVSEQLEDVENLFGKRIVDHEILSNGVRITTYETGEKIYVNRTDCKIDINGHTIQANGYYVEGGR